MQKDGPVLVMTTIFMLMAFGIILFGLIESARYSGFSQATLDEETSIQVAEK